MVKQVGLLAAGCQPWNGEVCAASSDRFAYCATLAIYVYQLDPKYNQFRLISILSEHKKTISAISLNPRNIDILASASYENKIIIWDVSKQRPLAVYKNTKFPPIALDWNFLHGEALTFIGARSSLFLWHYISPDQISSLKDSGKYSSDVLCFKWHPKLLEKVVFGHRDGSISFSTSGGKSHRHELRPEDDEDEDRQVEDSVMALTWDPLSTEYLLVSNLISGVRLVDSGSISVIMSFQLPSAAARVKTLAWIHTAPGMFLTGDSKSGILRIWNVSKTTPVENIKVKKTGFHAMAVICDRPSNKALTKMTPANQQSSTSPAQAPSMVNSSHFALPPARVVSTFSDGGVGLYDIGRRKWEFLREQSHIETIFDCKFCPNDANILATGSFDGTIKTWDTTSFTCTSPGNEGIIYTISWAPSDLNCIVGGTSKKGVFIWDIAKGRIIKRFDEHGTNSVFTVVWSKKDSRRIMSVGADGLCVIRQVDGEVLQKYKHPAAVYGCDWCPHNKDMLATGCEDGKVRVFYSATSNDQPLKVFSGHTAKVFHVNTVRIWDYSEDACLREMKGHKGPVRGLLWNSEIPYLLASGSWDSCICLWDIRSGVCLYTLHDHGADVYGLTSHPSRPFILASSSRDSTASAGTDNLWELVAVETGLDDSMLSSNYSKGIMHVKHLVKFTSSEAQELEMSRLTKTVVGVGKGSREDRLKHAADLHLQAGNLQRYCELTVELGQWERALAVAPGVSHGYWKSLCNRYSECLVQEESDLAPVFCTASGAIQTLVNFYQVRGQMQEAVLATQVACEGSSNIDRTEVKGQTSNGLEPSKEQQQLVHSAVKAWSEWYLWNGDPVSAACCLLAVSDHQGAMSRLLQGNELELAVAMGTVLGGVDSLLHTAIELLSRRCERLGKWYLAIDLLLRVPDSKRLLAMCCARCSGSEEERNTLYQRAQLPCVDECLQEAQRLKRQSDMFECVMYYLLSQSPELGLDLGVDFVHKQMKGDGWTADTVFPMLQLLGCVRTEVLQTHRKKCELLSYSFYIGALMAIRREYHSIVGALFKFTLGMLASAGSVEFAVPHEKIASQYAAWQAAYNNRQRDKIAVDRIPTDLKSVYDTLLHRAGTETSPAHIGGMGVASAHLPSHSDIHLSCLTQSRIQGLPYFLEDCKSTVSHSEALMWAKVCPFSPLATAIK
ncbi:WDR17-like protein [Mya arenaria]|uniref:WDR17-like protein n=1 Tax=Mya arenaria TaxID=6604 RepID=A0ABY7DKA8_MYAAR|nr:WDR17-like protein [Mya arenaria]